jgi:hypothetical protein
MAARGPLLQPPLLHHLARYDPTVGHRRLGLCHGWRPDGGLRIHRVGDGVQHHVLARGTRTSGCHTGQERGFGGT